MTATSSWFAGLDHRTKFGMLANIVRNQLHRRIRRRLDVLDRAILDIATDTTVVIAIFDSMQKHLGPLSEEQIIVYFDACRHRDGALKALGIADPYRPRGN